ncbi:hypothetical protein [Candidatus Chloroploca sp. Khr17]|uniref:hypothetical protein n=1 Tax=Candidatus Chloroploca sp. Khr17 TaxID=2496869 RepID=UPI00101D7EFF|nr:hypothetical protein [Candidatus Chloroploca sp. Khr17]
MRSLLTRYNPYLFLALAIALAYHGALLLSGTYTHTYDAFVHIFFADHYARAWFDHWEPRWYTGFPMTSYPPGSQQSIALLSSFVGLKTGFVIVALFAVLNVTLGIYRFSKIWVSEEAAGYAALILVFASCIAETVHVFGQLPTMFSLGFLLNALPFVQRWLDEGKIRWLLTAWLLNAATTAGHHVTTLFGAVFFVAPVIGLSLVTAFRTPLPDEPLAHPGRVTWANLRPLIMRRVRRVLPATMRAAVYGPGLIAALVLVVLPYWLWSKADPITQVSIPHASRDSFIVNTSAGLVFWLIPYGLSLIALPYVFYKGMTTRAWPMTLSLAALVFLGTGGTTPFPRMLLGGAFDVLTLDRFTFWATITMMPLLGEFVVSLRHRGLATYLREQFGTITWRLLQVSLIITYLSLSAFVANLTQFRRFQPDPIDFQPIVTFLEKDEHWRWRYLTLGFGDQMAWLSAQTTASTVDGNYHSARRLPELTTTPVERLEGSKYSGVPGIGSLQQFLAVPDKYNLKFVFSNDQFYDPLLFFSGWHRLQRLENGIMVWEREDIPPLPEVLPRKEIPLYQRAMWGIIPLTAIVAALIAFSSPIWLPYLRWLLNLNEEAGLHTPLHLRSRLWGTISWPLRRLLMPLLGAVWARVDLVGRAQRIWAWLDGYLRRWSALPAVDDSPVVPWQVWLDWGQRLPHLRPATPTAHHVRLALLMLIAVTSVATAGTIYVRQARTPVAVVERYYDDLDFRRFSSAYARLDPLTRPPYDQYLLDLSVTGGMVASYGKLNSVYVQVVAAEPERVSVIAETDWVTSLTTYPTRQHLTLVLRDGRWHILLDPVDTTVPPEPFFRRGEIGWVATSRRRIVDKPTAFADILDRPEIQILSARLVRYEGRYMVVGELINSDSDPADVTVTALLRDPDGVELTRYNAQQVMMHKLFPKEITPFRVDFEGVAGAVLTDTVDLQTFKPEAFTPPLLTRPLGSFDVFAKAVVTRHDLSRNVSLQNLAIVQVDDGSYHLRGHLFNTGTIEATIPHVLLTYYDDQNQVAWVDHVYIRDTVRPQRSLPIDLALAGYGDVELVSEQSGLFGTNLVPEVSPDAPWRERLPLPGATGFASLRVSVHAFEGGGL